MKSRITERVAPGVYRLRILFVNVYLVGDAASWVLVDAGLYGSSGRIRRAAEECFGPGARPRALILTHGHFDHTGAIELADEWDVPIYAHRLEAPYLTGRSSYPPPDPTVGKGGMALMSWAYPKGPIDMSHRLRLLPEDESVPFLHAWRWIHSPGHTPGHVALFRESDRVLLPADAFVTTKQESVTAVAAQRREIHGPPAYFTPDWPQAYRSVRRLLELEPRIVAAGHGAPMSGPPLLNELRMLVERFDELAVPSHGRYVGASAVADERGVVWVPPPAFGGFAAMLLGLGIAAAGFALASVGRHRPERHPYTLPRGW